MNAQARNAILICCGTVEIVITLYRTIAAHLPMSWYHGLNLAMGVSFLVIGIMGAKQNR
jgi:hypothetical protein